MTGDIFLDDLNTQLISSTTVLQLLPSTASHSSFLWTTPPTARHTQRHTGRETDSKDRQGGRQGKKKEKKVGREGGRTKRSRQDKETEDETNRSLKSLSGKHSML